MRAYRTRQRRVTILSDMTPRSRNRWRDATVLLMDRFYENLLGTPEGTVRPMPKAEALAEAKRWLRGLGPDEVRQLTKDLPTRGTRGRGRGTARR